jgi:ADP-heptose:LPS heptosyltransferase
VILALRALKLGDLLVAVPALRAIRRFWPDERLVLATGGWLYPLIRLACRVDQVLPVGGLQPLPAAARFPDVAINLHGAGPQSNRILDQLRPGRLIGHDGHGWPGPAWLDGIHERERWCRMLAAHGVPADPADLYLERPGVASPAPGAAVIHPGAACGSKRWPVARFAEVARRLAAGNRIVLTGTAKELPIAQAVASRAGLDKRTVLAGRTSLPELAALISDASLGSAVTPASHTSPTPTAPRR